MVDPAPSIASRKAKVLSEISIAEIVEQHVKLSGSASSVTRRGKCPFHGSSSASFSVKSPAKLADGFAHCFGCQWHGNAIDFLMAIKGWSFMDALVDLEGGDASAPERGPVQRARNPGKPRERERHFVSSLEAGRAIWKMATTDHDAVRRYFLGRDVPAAVLTDDRLFSFRFAGMAPIGKWELGEKPSSVLQAPAVVALVRKLVWLDAVEGGQVMDFVPVGVHVTYLNPEGTGTMVRRKPWVKPKRDGTFDEDPFFPKRKMFWPEGSGGGAVLLGRYQAAAPMFVGEGNETVFSGMGIAKAPAEAIGVATLSLDNLQGQVRKWNGGIWPLHKIAPDPAKRGFLIPGHRGPVTGLIDSDMSPLKDQLVVERKGGPIERRAITGAERAAICGELFVQNWRHAGADPVAAMRAPMGMDFNDVVQAEAA